ncbi:MAG: Fic family protein [Actinomycetota bacterium]
MLLPFKVTSVTTAGLGELDEWRSRLDYKEPVPRSWAGRLRRDLEAEAVAASTIMEGVPVTLEDVRRILAGDQAVPVGNDERQLVLGYEQAMNFVLRRADDATFQWNRELVIGLHDRVLAGRFDLGAGGFRSGQTRVVDVSSQRTLFLPPASGSLPGLADEICERVSRPELHPALASAWVHIALAAIHPFKDGNGRTCRVLASLAMYRGGFRRKEFTSLEEWWGSHKADYYTAFKCLGDQFTRGADVTPFVETHVQAQLSQVRGLDLRERVERKIWTVLEDLAEQSGLARRAANALWDSFFGRDVSAGYYRALADVSPATATNDLALASAVGFLRAKGRARARVYLAGDKLYESVAAALGLNTGLDAQALKASIIESLTSREIER